MLRRQDLDVLASAAVGGPEQQALAGGDHIAAPGRRLGPFRPVEKAGLAADGRQLKFRPQRLGAMAAGQADQVGDGQQLAAAAQHLPARRRAAQFRHLGRQPGRVPEPGLQH